MKAKWICFSGSGFIFVKARNANLVPSIVMYLKCHTYLLLPFLPPVWSVPSLNSKNFFVTVLFDSNFIPSFIGCHNDL